MLGVIIAAGNSERMGNLTEDKPKCLLEVNGKTIIDWELEAFEKANIKNILIIRGYQGEKLSPILHKYLTKKIHIHFCWNNFWMKNDILGSLMTAKEFIKNENFICCYSDILFKFSILETLKMSISPLVLAYDTKWKERYKFRSEHLINEAELIGFEEITETETKLKIGKGIKLEGAIGEFTGIVKFNKIIWPEILKNSEEILEKNPKAYLTDLLQILMLSKFKLGIVSVFGEYCQIDTPQDLEIARRNWKND